MSTPDEQSRNDSTVPRQPRLLLRTPEDWNDPALDAAPSVFAAARDISDEQLRRLAALPDLTKLELVGLRRSIALLAASRSLRELRLTDPATLDGLEDLRAIEALHVYCLPRIRSLKPLRSLSRLRTLLLSTPPSYDASRKCHHVESLAPVAHLQALEHLVMRGILPARDRLEPLHALKRLRTLTVSHVFAFSIEDYARLSRALPSTDGYALRPYFPAPWAPPCQRCGGERVGLTGARSPGRRVLCVPYASANG